ncbi:MAG: hypothetical protein RLZZ618_2138 [Pseudomonadota bacterium]|jgi:predicted neuraminidase
MGWGVTAVALVCVALSAGFEWRRWKGSPKPTIAAVVEQAAGASTHPSATAKVRLVPQAADLVPMPPGVPAAHASALAVLPNDEMLAFWWAGTRESGADVRVYVSRWKQGRWTPAQAVVDRQSLGAQLGFAVRRIGNPAAWVAPDGRVHLYVVATGLGGWAAGRVVQLVSTDQGRHFEARRVLPLTPLFNTSVLVRTTPIGLADGGWLLPAYFELGNKYPLLMSFDGSGAPRWLVRIGNLTTSLQPALVAVNGLEMRALMRDIGKQRRMQQAISRDAGETWNDLPPSEVVNHDSSVAALRLKDGGFAMLHNDILPNGGSPRQWLRLSTSRDAQQWSSSVDVLLGQPGDEFSYPSVQQVGQQLHVTFTSQRKAIAHHVFDIRYEEPTR